MSRIRQIGSAGTKFLLVALALGIALVLTGGPASAAGDAARGEKVFKKCMACHTLKAGKARKMGPHLNGVFGRKAGAVDGFRYSKALRKSSVVWNDETLDAFLKRPRRFLPGTRMGFAGLRKERQREDLLAFLKKATR